MGYHRADGCLATRNHVGILTSANFSGQAARFIAEAAAKDPDLPAMASIDGFVPIVPPDCGKSGGGRGR